MALSLNYSPEEIAAAPGLPTPDPYPDPTFYPGPATITLAPSSTLVPTRTPVPLGTPVCPSCAPTAVTIVRVEAQPAAAPWLVMIRLVAAAVLLVVVRVGRLLSRR